MCLQQLFFELKQKQKKAVCAFVYCDVTYV